ncbi:MAG: OB-fold nucleic acid binding domain-containing protein [Nanoarchaeota archaeon]
MQLNYESIIQKIIEITGKNRAEVESKIQQKTKELSELVSRDGAAHIVANEMGVKLYDLFSKTSYKVKELKAGLQNVELVSKIVEKYETRTFKKNERTGRVASMLVGDETGMVRVVIWDEVLINKSDEINVGDIIKLQGGYVKENNGFREVHAGSKSILEINPVNESVGEVTGKHERSVTSKSLNALEVNDFAEVRGTIVQLFDPKFYPACPECNKKVQDGKCVSHGVVKFNFVPILNFVLDDGSDNIRVVCFRDVVGEVIGVEKEKVQGFMDNPASFQDYKNKILGRQFVLNGKVTKNMMFDRLEFTASKAQELNVQEALQDIIS